MKGPLLSDEEAGQLAWRAYAGTSSPEQGGIAVRNWYEKMLNPELLRDKNAAEYVNNAACRVTAKSGSPAVFKIIVQDECGTITVFILFGDGQMFSKDFNRWENYSVLDAISDLIKEASE